MRTWQVGDVMTTDVATVTEDTPYRDIIDVVTDWQISAVPVVDTFGYVRGVVSESDLLLKVEMIGDEPAHRIFERRRRRRDRVKADAAIARDLMTSPAITTLASTPLVSAAKLMHTENVKRLPVTDDLGRIIGIVTRGDLLKVHLRPDVDIQCDVGEEVLRKVLAVRDGQVRLYVTDGVVRLAGRVQRRSTAQLAGKLATQVGGVVEVRNELEYDVDDTVYAELGPPAGTPIAIA